MKLQLHRYKTIFTLLFAMSILFMTNISHAKYVYLWEGDSRNTGGLFDSYSAAVANIHDVHSEITGKEELFSTTVSYDSDGKEVVKYKVYFPRFFYFLNESRVNGWAYQGVYTGGHRPQLDTPAEVMANMVAFIPERNCGYNVNIVSASSTGAFSLNTASMPIEFSYSGGWASNPDGTCFPKYGATLVTKTDYIRGSYLTITITRTEDHEYYLASNEDSECPSASEGDPCDPATGRNFQSEQDINLNAVSLSFSRHYQSLGLGIGSGEIGANWRHTYSKKMNASPLTYVNTDGSLANSPVIKTSNYATAASACLNGWAEIKNSAFRGTLSNATANFSNNVCHIRLGDEVRATLPLHSTDNTAPAADDPRQTQVRSISRPNGNVFVFSLVNDIWLSQNNKNIRLTKTVNGWEFIDQNDHRELYDDSGNLIRLVKKNGHITTLTYDALDRLADVVGPFGHVINFRYDEQDRISTVTGPDGEISYTYDLAHNLAQVDFPTGYTKKYGYTNADFPHHLTSLTNENGDVYAIWDYDERGRVVTNELPNGVNRVDFQYNNDNTTTVTNSRGATRTYHLDTYNSAIKVKEITGELCTTCPGGELSTRTYDQNGFVNGTIDWSGKKTARTNDDQGRILSQIEAEESLQAREITYIYDPRFTQKILMKTEPSVVAEKNKVTHYEYDELGNLISSTITGYAPDGLGGDTSISRKITLKYEGPLGQVSEIDGPRPNDTVEDIRRFRYYADDPLEGDNRARLKTVMGQNDIAFRKDIQYNSSGNVISEVRPNGIDISYRYYAGSDRIESLTETSAEISRTTRWTYQPTGEVETLTQADGSALATTLTFRYDPANRLIGIEDTLGNQVIYTLDSEGNKQQEDIKDVTGTLYRTLQQTFDIYNRLDQKILIDETIDYDFAPNNTLSRVENAKNTVASYGYDALNRLTRVSNDEGGLDTNTQDTLTKYGYDVSDNLILVTSPNNAETRYLYDDLGNLLEENSSDRGKIRYAYDEAGNRLSSTDARGITANYQYDALDRVTVIDYPGTNEDVIYVYDSTNVCLNGIGKLCQITDESGVTDYSYDAFGNLVLQQKLELGVSYSTHYRYNLLDQVTQMTLPSGRVIDYTYDGKGRVISVDASVNGVTQTLMHNVEYRADDLLSQREFGNGFIEQRGYNLKGQLTSLTVPAKGVPNTQPMANAGADSVTNENTSVSLNGSESNDPDGNITQYHWVQTAGLNVMLNKANTALPNFLAPDVMTDTLLTFSLIVTDDRNAQSQQDTVNITVKNVNQRPIAHAGININANEMTLINLDGTASTDPDGNIVAYQWVQTQGPAVTLNDANSPNPTFITPPVITNSVLEFTLTVTDNEAGIDQASVNITVGNVNALPVADAGADQSTTGNISVTLDGSNSLDVDGTVTSYRWLQTSGTAVTLSDSKAISPSFVAPVVSVEETLVFQLTVTDNDSATNVASTHVVVSPISVPPVTQNYYVLNPNINRQPLNLVSLSDNNTITAGNTLINLNAHQRATIPTADLALGTKISGTGHFDVGSNQNGTDLLASEQLAGTDFVIPHFRNSHTYHLLSPYADATATITLNGTSTAVSLIQGIVKTYAAGANNNISGIITADQAILVSHRSGNNDAYLVPPVATQLVGIRSNIAILGALEDNTQVTVTSSNGASRSYTLDRGSRVRLSVGSSGREGQGNALHIEANKPIAAIQGADSDGVEATAFWPPSAFATHYALPVNTQYLAISCLTDNVSITLTDGTKTPVTKICNSDGVIPGKVTFGSSTDGININAGAVVESTGSIYLIYEVASTNDEHNLLGNATSMEPVPADPNIAPTAQAGADRSENENTLINLDGTTSTDTDGRIVTYVWTQISGPTVILNSPTTAVASFMAPRVNAETILTFELTVTDNSGDTDAATTQITVIPNTSLSLVQHYYVMNPNVKRQNLNLISLSDNNTITAGNTTLSLSTHQRATIPTADLALGTKISGTGHFEVGSNQNGTDLLAPEQLAGTDFVIPHFRNSHTYHLLSPHADATATITLNGTSTAVSLIQDIVETYAAGANNGISGIITADQAILVSHRSGNNDVYLVPPVATQLVGIRSNIALLGALEDNTQVTVTSSNGASRSYTLNRGSRVSLSVGSNGREGQGNALHIEANKPIAAIQGADSDGVEATAFWPPSVFARHYALPTNSQYIAISCLSKNVNIRLLDGTKTPVIKTCHSEGTVPGKVTFGSTNDGTNINAGATLHSTAPIYLIYENAATNDEKNLLGNVAPAQMPEPISVLKTETQRNGIMDTRTSSQLLIVASNEQPYRVYRKGKETQGHWQQTAEDPNAYDRPNIISYLTAQSIKHWRGNDLLSANLPENFRSYLKPGLANVATLYPKTAEYLKVAHGTNNPAPIAMATETLNYGYDANGNVSAITGQNDSASYQNDTLDRLTTDNSTQRGDSSYTYDRNGNRTRKNQNGNIDLNDYLSTSNRLISDTQGSITHDAAGNRTSDKNGTRTYEYNNAGRLWQVYENGQRLATYTYTYNALGQRTRKVTDSETTTYHYDLNGKLVTETTDVWGTSSDYIYMGSTPIAQINIGLTHETVNYLHTDHLGTPRRATDNSGNLVWMWESDGFGQAVANEDPVNSGTSTTMNLRFAGQYFDRETQLHYNYFRYYEPATGRYITSDPIGLEGGLNTFGYVGGNPLNLTDPTGLNPFAIPAVCAGTGACEAAVASLAAWWAVNIANSSTENNSSSNCSSNNNDNDDDCAKRNEAVKKAKQKVGRLGACKANMSRGQLEIRKTAWLNLAVSRAKRDQKCWAGGDSGHQQAQASAWNHVAKCESFM